jgi:hypothetical protein
MPRCSRLLSVAVLAALLVGATLSRTAEAQSSRTLVIQEGTVYLDGQRIPDDQLPASLDVSNIERFRVTFSGISRPVVELNGALYAIGESLEPVDPEAVSAQQSTARLGEAAPQAEAGAAQSSSPENAVRTSQLRQYRAQYLEEMQQRHKQLYERLMHERQMESETYDLARVIRQLPPGTEQQQYLDSLRTTLNEIFELKQENRRREIQQLENQITELRRRLEKREDMRDEMVEQRIQQLVGESNEPR